MNLPLIVNPEAEAVLAEAKDWYDGQRPGLGDELLDCVEEVFSRLRQIPGLYGEVFQDLRPDEDQVTVVAVYHTRRDPRGWQDRA